MRWAPGRSWPQRWVIALTGWMRADAVASLLIGVLIVPRTWKLLREESGQQAMASRCLSAAGLSFCGHPSPARDSAPLTIGLPAQTALDRDGLPRSAHARYDRNGRPLYPGTCGAHANQG